MRKVGDWGLGIAQSTIPNPQSPIKLNTINSLLYKEHINTNKII